MLESLRSLVTGQFDEQGVRLFACTPRLVRLEIVHRSRDLSAPDHTEKWNQVLPRLETIKCHYLLLLLFTSGRPVTSISINSSIRYVFLGMPKYFGSNVQITRLYIGIFPQVEELLLYMAETNAEVEELGIIYDYPGPKCEYSASILPNSHGIDLTLHKTWIISW